MGSKGSQTTSQTTKSAPDPAAYAAYQSLLERANQAGTTPFTPYSGELTAGINDQQQQGIAGINAASNYASPYFDQASAYARNAAVPISAEQIGKYQNPYTQQVVDATRVNFDDANMRQLQQVRGNAASLGALGGDREAVAEAEVARQQRSAQDPIIAGLYSTGFNTATQTALSQQQAQANAANQFAGFGAAGQTAALQGAGAQFGAGTAQQQTEQNYLNSLYQQWQQQQAFPYQQLGWQAGIATGVGSQLGGTSDGTKTSPGPNSMNSILGGGIALAGLAAAPFTGGASLAAVPAGVKAMSANGGRIPYAGGGEVSASPYGDAPSFIPHIKLTPGAGAPKLMDWGSEQQPKSPDMSGIGGFGGPFKPSTPSFDPTFGSTTGGVLPENILPGAGIGSAARGGRIQFADGGMPDISDVTSPNWMVARGFQDLGGFEPGEGPRPDDTGLAGALYDKYRPEYPIAGLNVPTPRARPAGIGVPMAGGDDMPAGVLAYGPPARKRPNPLAGIGQQPVANQGDFNELDAAADAPMVDEGALPPMATAASGTAPQSAGLGGFNFSQFSAPLIAAGLGMMASRSPYLGEAIGQGGLAGLQTYSGQRKAEQEQAATQQKLALDTRRVDQEATRLRQAADEARKRLELQTETLAETKRYHDKPEPGWKRTATGLEYETGGPHDPAVIAATAKAKGAEASLSPTAVNHFVERSIAGDYSWKQNIGRGAQGAANLTAVENAVTNALAEKGISGADQAKKIQEFRAATMGSGAEARTAGVRRANLDIILRATEAAIPAAIEASAKISRTGWVPINKIIQKGQVVASNPELREFGIANLQLAEHWARAMNPTGVMRESDRDLALHFLETADSHPTYVRAVQQVQKQIQRERVAVDSERSGAPHPAPTTAPAGPQVGEERRFKQGIGVWDGTKWVPKP